MSETPGRKFALLPMLGHTKGKRSPVTCALKCDNACSGDVCNTSSNSYFRDIASTTLSRRAALGFGAAGALAVVLGGCPGIRRNRSSRRRHRPVRRRQERLRTRGASKLQFTAIPSVAPTSTPSPCPRALPGSRSSAGATPSSTTPPRSTSPTRLPRPRSASSATTMTTRTSWRSRAARAAARCSSPTTSTPTTHIMFPAVHARRRRPRRRPGSPRALRRGTGAHEQEPAVEVRAGRAAEPPLPEQHPLRAHRPCRRLRAGQDHRGP